VKNRRRKRVWDIRSVVFDLVETDRLVHRFWDLGLAGGSWVMKLSKYHADFYWDPESLEGLQFFVVKMKSMQSTEDLLAFV
jgi:hypothetical protein